MNIIGPLLESNRVPLLSYIKLLNGIQIHSHPLYKMKEEWFDWVFVKWEYKNCNFEYVPGRVMHIIDMTNINLHVDNPYKPGLYVCIISLRTNMKKIPRSNIVYKGTYEKSVNSKLVFRIIELSSIYSNCFAIPDSKKFNMKELSECEEWLFVEGRKFWCGHFES